MRTANLRPEALSQSGARRLWGVVVSADATFCSARSHWHMGWSQGGAAVLFAIGTQSFSRPAQLPRGDFRAAVAFYPGSCDEQRQQPSWSTIIPRMVLIGAEDVGIPVGPCKALLDGAATRGAKVEMQIYPGAYHHFDWPNLPRRELPFPTAAGVVRIEGTDTAARQDAFSRIPSFLARFLTN